MGEAKRRKANGTYPIKHDTGIARLPNGMPILEATRDGINARIDKDTGALKPLLSNNQRNQGSTVNLNDPRTSSDLANERWSGVRQNAISRQTEIWIQGEIKKRISSVDLERNPKLLADAFEELFPGWGHLIQVDAEQFYRDPLIHKSSGG